MVLIMKIAELRIENLRAYHDQTIRFSDYTCLVGCNGAGKSTVLCALNIFFRETGDAQTNLLCLDKEDFHRVTTSQPIRITVTFVELPPDAQKDFQEYYRQGKLVISAVATFDPATQTADVKQFGQRMAMPAFKAFFAALGDKKTVPELKTRYEEIRKSFDALPKPGIKQQMIDALHHYENEHPELCELIQSHDQFYGFTSAANLLAKYVQWVYVPALKDATTEQSETKNSALGKLLARTVRSKTSFDADIQALRSDAEIKYQELLKRNQGTLEELSKSLRRRLADWAHPDASVKLEWRGDPSKSVRIDEPLAEIVAGEGDFQGQLARFGHGLQRSYLLALLQELAGSDDAAAPTLILACEEPELHQHPPQARHLADVLYALSKRNSQIILSTHSPHFVSGQRFEDIRLIRKEPSTNQARVSHVSLEEIGQSLAAVKGGAIPPANATMAKIHQALHPGINEMFFSKVIVLVEGGEDVAYTSTYLALLGLWDEFRRLGCHFVAAGSKSHMIQPLAIAKKLQIPSFVIFDSDGHRADRNGSRAMHAADNTAILKLCGVSNPHPFPSQTLWENGTVMWPSEIDRVVAEDLGVKDCQAIRESVRSHYGRVGGLNKNALFISDVLTAAWKAGKRSPVLEKLSTSIMAFARA
jgi:putative ATP-dependent endonuclease of OLD family